MQFLKQIETLFRTGTAGGLTDGQLLERFVERRGEDAEAAFSALVDRHGAMVLRVCRQILRGEEDAEDAAQAVFLVLARRAGSIGRRESVGCWLHGVALRVAAKVRAAASRRRARELRGGEMRIAGHVIAAGLEAVENHEDWATLHDELGSLPQAFREPLVLCYFEGLTQEQAAAQLQRPLGTIQSRLARGRAKLKVRLEKRGVGLSAAFAGENYLSLQSCPAPRAWAEATVKLAMQFPHGNGSAITGASAASVALAEEVARAMIMTKLKVTAAMILIAAVLVTGAAAWAMNDREVAAIVVATQTARPGLKPEREPAQEKAPAPPEHVTRTIRGIVRDEQGQPLAKAWIGSECRERSRWWSTVVEPLDRIRERKESFRDEQGMVVPAGALGKYYEIRDQEGKWQPIHPADIRRCERQSVFLSPFEPAFSEEVKTALDKGNDVFRVLSARGGWEMQALGALSEPADRTDPQGNFFVEFTMSPEFGAQIVHFASPDFSREAIFAVRWDDPDEVLSITLRPVRLVRATLLETPKDHPEESLKWDVFTVDPKAGSFDETAACGGKGALWLTDFSEDNSQTSVPYAVRRFEARLPSGHYKIRFNSDTMSRLVDIVVPAGGGPLDLPDIHLETVAWAKMLGKAAAEIDAVDLSGKPVKLADYRGDVLVLCFWSSKNEKDSTLPELPRLAQIRRKFKGQPLAILVLHDSSITSVANFNQAVAPFVGQFKGESPVQFVLDRKLTEMATSAYAPHAGEVGSGRTSDALAGSGATLVIDRSGTLVAATHLRTTFSIGKDGQLLRDFGENRIHPDGLDIEPDREFPFALLARSLEDQFGLPRSPLPKPKSQLPTPGQLKGRVVDLDGRPIAGARIFGFTGKNSIRTGPTGEFIFSVEERRQTVIDVNVEASGFAARCFKLWIQNEDRIADLSGHANFVSVDPSGVARQPLKMSPGVAVTGRVLQNGKPIAGVLIGMKEIAPDLSSFDRKPLEASTDLQGSFRFPHSLPETEFWVYAKLGTGTLADGGAVIPQWIRTTEEGSTTDLGEFHVEKGFTLAGQVVCSDGKPVPSGTSISAECPNADGSLSVKLDETGRFEFKGLAAGPVSVRTHPAGYFVSAKNRCHGPSGFDDFDGQLQKDITDLTILVKPGERPDGFDPDPALVADFNDARAGPITGVPPRL